MPTAFSRFIPLLSCLLTAGLSSANVQPQLVKDLNSGPVDDSAGPYAVLGNSVFMTGTSIDEGRELWKSDGTPGGTVMVKDIRQGALDSSPSSLTTAGNFVYFSAVGPSNGRNLWCSDGTTEGTNVVSTGEIAPGPPSNLTAFGNRLVFTSTDSVAGTDLWITDGTLAGTARVKDFGPGNSSQPIYQNLTSVGTTLYFSLGGDSANLGIWKSDGTSAGTVRLTKAASAGKQFVALGDSVYFLAKSSGSSVLTLWETKGTAATTVEVSASSGGIDTYGTASLVVMGGRLYFNRQLSHDSVELWRSDGTTASTVKIADVGECRRLFASPVLPASPPALYFFGSNATFGTELWKSDGTAAGTGMLLDISAGPSDSYPDGFTLVGNKLFFAASQNGDSAKDLWTTDGSTAGTHLIRHLSQFTRTPAAFGNTLIFTGSDGQGPAVWRSDGTAAGTSVLKDFLGTGNSSLTLFHAAGDKLFFSSFLTSNTADFLLTDGTAAGTTSGANTALWGYNDATDTATTGGTLFFSGSSNGSRDNELWKSDATNAGTQLVTNINATGSSAPASFSEINSKIFFTADDGIHGREPWITDGTATGTVMLQDASSGSDGSYPANVTRGATQLYFTTGGSAPQWNQLWKTDGTPAGTSLVVADNGSCTGLAATGDVVFYVKGPGFGSNEQAIWRSDGTPGGTYQAGILPFGPSFSISIDNVKAAGGLAFVTRVHDSPTGKQTALWRSDGSSAGTYLALTATGTPPASYLGFPPLTAVGNSMVFWTDDGTRFRLWGSDGTAGGSALLYTSTDHSGVAESYATGKGALYFLYRDGVYAYNSSIWKTDGTLAGTGPVLMDYPDILDLSKLSLIVAGSNLYFPFTTNAYGRELYTVATADLKTQGDVYRGNYRDWAAAAGLTGPASDPLARPFGDATNLLKYASFLDPSHANGTPLVPGSGTAGLPAVSFTDSPQGKILHLEYIRRKDRGLTYTPEISTSLDPGSFAALTETPMITPIDAERERATVDHLLTPSEAERCFAHVAVSGL